MSASLMIRKVFPSILISVPAYWPYKMESPTFTDIGSSFLPDPAATTVPRNGFSFAVSGIMIPLAVFCSAGAGSTRTLSAKGLKFTDIKNILSCWTLFEKHANCSFASKLHNGQKKCQYAWHTDILKIKEYELLTLALTLVLALALIRCLLLGLWCDLFWWFWLANWNAKAKNNDGSC